MARYGQAYRDRIVARLLPLESSAVEFVSGEMGERWSAGRRMRCPKAQTTGAVAAVNAGRRRPDWKR